MKGEFTAVVHGEFRTGGGLRPALVATLLGIVALMSWLVTVLVDLAIAAGAFAVAVTAACWLLRRRPDRDSELLAERITAMRADTGPQALPARVVEYHVHLAPGMTAEDAASALLQHRDAITSEGEQE